MNSQGATMSDLTRKGTSELIGTFVLVFFGAGAAVFGLDVIGGMGVAFAFGLTLLALAYAIGPTSGCHVNPAVTLGVLLRRGISVPEAGVYWVAQIVGGVTAGALLKLMVSDFGEVTDQTGALGTNAWGDRVSGGGAFVFEVLATCLLVLVVILVTGRAAAPGFAGLAIGLVLIVVHLVGVPLDGTSVNPARSLGPALFAGSDALSQVWLFVVAPLVGAVLAALVAPVFDLPSSQRAAQAPGTDPTGAGVPS
ncbi:MAG: aquaporin [Aeromicrobium sp.]